MSDHTPSLPAALLDSSLSIGDTARRLRWYMCVVVSLSSLGYPDVIPQVYEHFNKTVLSSLPSADQYSAVQRVREGLIKSVGVVGAGRTGNAMRTLSQCVPEEFREKDSPRSKESDEVARERGRAFWTHIYARNPAFDPEASVRASPDYAFIVRDLLYARVFSYDGVLDSLTTGYAMVSGLYGLDCQNQLQHHMKGMLFNGASRQDLVDLTGLCRDIATALGVRFRGEEPTTPEIPEVPSKRSG